MFLGGFLSVHRSRTVRYHDLLYIRICLSCSLWGRQQRLRVVQGRDPMWRATRQRDSRRSCWRSSMPRTRASRIRRTAPQCSVSRICTHILLRDRHDWACEQGRMVRSGLTSMNDCFGQMLLMHLLQHVCHSWAIFYKAVVALRSSGRNDSGARKSIELLYLHTLHLLPTRAR
jgi:hypothetical protein